MDANPHPNMEEESLVLSAYLDVIKRRRWWFAASALLVFSLSMIYIAKMKPVYRAQVLVRVGRGGVESSILNDLSHSDDRGKDFFKTQCEILSSRAVLDRVMNELSADSSCSLSLGDIKKNLKVELVPGTFLVRIEFESQNPLLAARVANLVPQGYLKWRRLQQTSTSKETLEWLHDETGRLQHKADTLYTTIEEYREKDDSSQSAEVLEVQREEAARQYIKARLKRVSLENKHRSMKGLLKKNADMSALPVSLASDRIRELQKMRHAKNQELAQANNVFKPKHPKVVQLRADLEAIDEELRLSLQNLIDELHTEYNYALSEEKVLSAHLKTIETRLAQKRKAAFELTKMQKNVESVQEVHDVLLRKSKEAEIVERKSLPDFSVIDQASLPAAPAGPNRPARMLFSLLIALLVGLGVAFVVEYADTSISSSESVNRVLQQNCLGEIPLVRGRDKSDGVLFEIKDMAVNEAFKGVDTNLHLLASEHGLRRILVTSTFAGEGKTFISANLAAKMAEVNRKVLLIDSDFFNATLSKEFGLYPKPGLSNVLKENVDVMPHVVSPNGKNLFVLGSGNSPLKSSILSYRQRVGEVFQQLEQEFDVLLIDAPPSGVTADVAAIASQTDGVVFVVHSQKTNQSLIRKNFFFLKEQKVRVLGVVLNFTRPNRYGSYYSSYYQRSNA